MILSQKRKQNIKKRNSNRKNNRVMKGLGDTYNPNIDAALTYLNIYSRTLIEDNENLADYFDECMSDLLPIYQSNDLYKALDDVKNYLKGKVSELKSIIFNSDVEAEYLCKELNLDSKSCITALASLCIYNLVERELRHMAFEQKTGGSPFTKRKAVRKVAQVVVAGTSSLVVVSKMAAVGVCADVVGSGIAYGACAIGLGPALLLGAGVGFCAYHATFHLVNGLYINGEAAAVKAGEGLNRVGEAMAVVLPRDPFTNQPQPLIVHGAPAQQQRFNAFGAPSQAQAQAQAQAQPQAQAQAQAQPQAIIDQDAIIARHHAGQFTEIEQLEIQRLGMGFQS